MTEELPLCACGCGERVTKMRNKYIQYHHKRGCFVSDKTKELASKSMKLVHFKDPTIARDHSEFMTNLYKDPKERRKDSEYVINAHKNDPSIAVRMSVSTKKAYIDDPTINIRISESLKRTYKENPELCQHQSDVSKSRYDKMDDPGQELLDHHVAYDFNDPDALKVRITRKFHGQIHSPKGLGVHQRGYSLID